VMAMMGLPAAAEFRVATAALPGSQPLVLEFIEFKGPVDMKVVNSRVQDPGSYRLQLNVRDIDETLAALKKAGSRVLSSGGAPVRHQEVWAAGVTYYRSRTARIEESKTGGGSDFYDRVYSAVRPELFFKATPSRVAGSGQEVRIRRDSNWNVPEPELALAVNS